MGVFINYKSFWGRDFINAALLVVIHIQYVQKWAGGHRYSLRRNVCRPATMRTHTHTIKKYMQHFKYKKRYLPFLQLISTAICEEFSMRNA